MKVLIKKIVRRVIKKLVKIALPLHVRKTLQNYEILSARFGQYATMRDWDSIDAEGSPIPWYSYPAIEYLKQFDFSEKRVFEFGSGNSTIFWAGRSKLVVSVEDDRAWFDKTASKLPESVQYIFCEGQGDYVNQIRIFDEKFDIVIIDGKYRSECVPSALDMLADDGFVILDNSDWHESASALLRDADLIEVDMAGFGPINGYTTTTSFYFRRSVKLRPLHHRQPVPGIGALHHRDVA